LTRLEAMDSERGECRVVSRVLEVWCMVFGSRITPSRLCSDQPCFCCSMFAFLPQSPLCHILTLSGVKVAGHRGYFLTNDGVDLNQALINYGLDFLRKRGFKKIQPPYMMNKDLMAKTAQLEEFDEALYKVGPAGCALLGADSNSSRLERAMTST
jgi:hypothetical protein